MRNDVFLQKLGEVADWEWVDVDTHKPCEPKPTAYPRITEFKKQCNWSKKKCNILVDKKNIDGKRFWYERCNSCKHAKDKQGNWIKYTPSNIIYFLRKHVIPD